MWNFLSPEKEIQRPQTVLKNTQGLKKKKNNLSSQENLLDLDDTGYSIDSI